MILADIIAIISFLQAAGIAVVIVVAWILLLSGGHLLLG
jgi:hypothetical protein